MTRLPTLIRLAALLALASATGCQQASRVVPSLPAARPLANALAAPAAVAPLRVSDASSTALTFGTDGTWSGAVALFDTTLPGAKWVWDTAQADNGGTAVISKSFTLPQDAANIAGAFDVACDDSCKVFVNNTLVAEVVIGALRHHTIPAGLLAPGQNTMVIEGHNNDCPGCTVQQNPGCIVLTATITFGFASPSPSPTPTPGTGAVTLSATLTPQMLPPLADGQVDRAAAATTTVRVAATQDGAPVPGLQIALKAESVPGSGGHNHDGDRPAGVFLATGTPQANATTDAQGVATIVYRSSGFGGQETITAAANNANPAQPVLDVRLNLGALADPAPPGGDGQPIYILVGQTTDHPASHFGTPRTLEMIRAIAADYAALPQRPDVSPERALALNDMSLPGGGPFDLGPPASDPVIIFGKRVPWWLLLQPFPFWTLSQKHVLHREGRSIDMPPGGIIRAQAVNGSFFNTATGSRLLRAILRSHRCAVFNEGNHWHVTVPRA